MKRIAGIAAALLAALVVTGGGGFSSCSGGSSYEGTAAETKTLSFDTLWAGNKDPITDVRSQNPAIAEVTDGKQATRLTAGDGQRITEFTITAKKSGSTYIIITAEASDGTKVKRYLPVTVSSSLALTTEDLTDTEPEESGGATGGTTYTLDISKAVSIQNEDSTPVKIDDVVTIYASANNKNIQAKGTYIQMTGGAVNAGEGTEYGLRLTLAKDATITAKATAKTTNTTLRLIDSNGKNTDATTQMTAGGSSINAADAVEITFENVAAGTYMFGSSSGGCNLFSLVIEYKQ